MLQCIVIVLIAPTVCASLRAVSVRDSDYLLYTNVLWCVPKAGLAARLAWLAAQGWPAVARDWPAMAQGWPGPPKADWPAQG